MTAETGSGHVYPHWSFGDRVRKARTIAHMTQEEFGAAIGVKMGTLAAWETDRAQPRSREIIEVVKRIEEVTEVPVDWLLGIVEDGPPPEPPARRPFRQIENMNRPMRHLRPVTPDRELLNTPGVTDDALAYVRLASDIPFDESPDPVTGWLPVAS